MSQIDEIIIIIIIFSVIKNVYNVLFSLGRIYTRRSSSALPKEFIKYYKYIICKLEIQCLVKCNLSQEYQYRINITESHMRQIVQMFLRQVELYENHVVYKDL